MEHFKILMFKGNGLYCVYDTKTKTVECCTDIKPYKIRCIENRRSGTYAVVYQADKERYIAVAPNGEHFFRTLRELKYQIKDYFNIEIKGHELKSLDGEIPKADQYIKSITYVDMYNHELHNKLTFNVDKISGEVYVNGYKSDNIDSVVIPNFAIGVKANSFVSKSIQHVLLNRHVKQVEDMAFKHSEIDKLVIDRCSESIEPLAFYGCSIREACVVASRHEEVDSVLNGVNIDTLDLSRFNQRLSSEMFTVVKHINKVILPYRCKQTDVNMLHDCMPDLEIIRQ